jgi:hypothetical protein
MPSTPTMPCSHAFRLTFVFLAVCVSVLSVSRLHAQSGVTLRLMEWADLDEMALDRQAIALFVRLHPNIRIVYEPNPGRQYEEKILTGLAANEPPDVFLLDSKLIPTFTNKGVLLDLSLCNGRRWTCRKYRCHCLSHLPGRVGTTPHGLRLGHVVGAVCHYYDCHVVAIQGDGECTRL